MVTSQSGAKYISSAVLTNHVSPPASQASPFHHKQPLLLMPPLLPVILTTTSIPAILSFMLLSAR